MSEKAIGYSDCICLFVNPMVVGWWLSIGWMEEGRGYVIGGAFVYEGVVIFIVVRRVARVSS